MRWKYRELRPIGIKVVHCSLIFFVSAIYTILVKNQSSSHEIFALQCESTKKHHITFILYFCCAVNNDVLHKIFHFNNYGDRFAV